MINSCPRCKISMHLNSCPKCMADCVSDELFGEKVSDEFKLELAKVAREMLSFEEHKNRQRSWINHKTAKDAWYDSDQIWTALESLDRAAFYLSKAGLPRELGDQIARISARAQLYNTAKKRKK